jgi:hypothetical protein
MGHRRRSHHRPGASIATRDIRPERKVAELIHNNNQGGFAALRRNGAARAALWLEAPLARARQPGELVAALL